MTNEVISAWEIYWVMQLDSISCLFGFLFFGGMIASGLALFFGGLVTDFYGDSWDRICHTVKRVVAVALISGGVGTFIPSTKTAAAMILIPAIANNETIQKEAGDLYGLAKQALREAVGGDKKEAKE